jgi:hypothetical protein
MQLRPAVAAFPLKSVSAAFTLRNLIEQHFAIGLAVVDDIQQDTFLTCITTCARNTIHPLIPRSQGMSLEL